VNPEVISNLVLSACDQSEKVIRAATNGAPTVIAAMVNYHPLTILLPSSVKSQIITLIVREIEKAADLLLEAIATFRTLARSFGRPTELRNAADTLSTSVASGATTLSSDMVPGVLLGLDQEHWKSSATTPYSTGLTEQARSVDRIAEVVGHLESTLRDMADSIETFYADLNWAWIGAALAIAGFAVGIATAGPTLGVGAVVGIVLGAIGVIQALISLVMTATAAGDRNAANAEGVASAAATPWTTSVFAA
jgi:hypothetical protein